MTNGGEDEILHEIGLSEEKLRTYLRKLNEFYDSLTAGEKKVLRASLPSCAQAVRSFRTDVTREQLRNFIRERAPARAHFTCGVNGVGVVKPKKEPE